MNRTLTLISVCFCAGLLGALCSSTVTWLFGGWGIPDMLGVSLAPAFTKQWLYPQLIWGGLWGLVYFLTVGARSSRRHWTRKALWISILPSAFQLFIVYPYWTHHDLLGFGLGQFTAVFIVAYNLVWGLFTGIFSRLLWGRN
jgi:hypothetical protein